MDIDTNKSSGEEEYRPADYDSSVFEATPATAATASSAEASTGGTNAAANLMEHINRRNIFIAVGVIVGIFCIYKIADVLFTPGEPRHKTALTPTLQAQMPAAMQQPAIQASAP